MKKLKIKKRKYKLTKSDIIFHIINYTIFGLFTLATIFPFYYLFINTISGNDLVQKGVINFVPKAIHFKNYLALQYVNDLGKSFLITLSRTIIGTVTMVIASTFLGYIVTKKEMKARKFWYRFLIVTMYFNAGLIPWYINMSLFGLTDNFMGYIIPGLISPFNVILVKTYIESIPADLEESAYMDGAGYLSVFKNIIWPLSKPIIATIAIFGAVGHWNSFMDSLILMQNTPSLYTLQHRLYIYLTSASNLENIMNSSPGSVAGMLNAKVVKYTISMVTIIPILIVYPFMQRYFQEGIMLGAVKG